jgi:large subunit ribosomal protein L4
MQIPIHTVKGKEIGQIDLDDNVFDVPMNEPLIHQALVRQRANARLGTASTKTRSEVSGSTKKLYRQKHTGRARAGDLRSPLRRHGGVIFGPHPRSYRQKMPKKMRRLAIKCLLSSKVAEGQLKIVNKISIKAPNTREMATVLETLNIKRSALVVLPLPEVNIVKSAANLPKVKVTLARLINVVDLLSHNDVIITTDAVEVIHELWGSQETATSNS